MFPLPALRALATRRLAAGAIASLFLWFTPASASAKRVPPSERKERKEPLPEQLQGVGITEHLGDALPLDLEFVDESGTRVKLRDYFGDDKPVILTLNYSNCPMLCSLELNGLVDGLRQLEWSPGEEFRILTVSLDPEEGPERARRTKAGYVQKLDRKSTDRGWHFLTGKRDNIRALASAVGFRYRYDEDKNEFYHAAALMLATPSGRLARYLYGVEFTPRTLRLGLVEASEGEIGNPVDQLILYCCAYDPEEGSYAAVANRIMNVSGVAFALLLGGFLGVLWMRELRSGKGGRES